MSICAYISKILISTISSPDCDKAIISTTKQHHAILQLVAINDIQLSVAVILSPKPAIPILEDHISYRCPTAFCSDVRSMTVEPVAEAPLEGILR